jgi:hypothetical protein
MFKITPIQDKTRQKDICEKCGAAFREDFFAYEMYDCETLELMGMSQFQIGENGYISDLREPKGKNDFEAMFILGRQTMNFINACGAPICKASLDAAVPSLLSAIGFKESNDDMLVCNTEGMFDGKCGNH